jgi:hypothetical protein
MKTCLECSTEKPLDDFHSNGQKRKSICRGCYAKNRRNWKSRGGSRDREVVRHEHRERFAAKASEQREYYERSRKKDPEKRNARLVISMRIYRGTLTRPDACEDCGTKCKPQAHHDDYSKPLDVRWLCLPCHRKADVERRAKEVA